jgi:hypothetical protein
MKAAHGYAAACAIESTEVGICNMPLDIGLDAGAPRIPVLVRRRCLDLLAHGVPGHAGQRVFQALSAGRTEAVHLLERLGQRGDQDTRYTCVLAPQQRPTPCSSRPSRSGSNGRSNARTRYSLRASNSHASSLSSGSTIRLITPPLPAVPRPSKTHDDVCSRGLDQSLQARKLDLELHELHLEFLSSSCQMWLSPNCVVLLLLLLCHLATLLALQAVARVQPART